MNSLNRDTPFPVGQGSYCESYNPMFPLRALRHNPVSTERNIAMNFVQRQPCPGFRQPPSVVSPVRTQPFDVRCSCGWKRFL